MGWRQLLDIYAEGAADLRAERSARPQACPNDGTPLISDQRGVLRCTHDGWSEDQATPRGC